MFRQYLILAKANIRAFQAKAGGNLRESKLLVGTLGLFLLGYLVVGYFIFALGLKYLYDLPGIGLILVERVHYMLFFLFFVMLIFSNSILLYSGLFRGKETPWLFTLPLNRRAIFLWKVTESFLISSWGVAILTAPMLVAFGKLFKADGWYFPKALLLYLPYLLLPATIAAALVVILVRCWGRTTQTLLLATVGFIAWKTITGWLLAESLLDSNASTSSEAIRQVLGHTEMAVHPLVPSTWVSEQLFLWARGYGGKGWFYAGLLFSCALLGMWLCTELFSRSTFSCWVRSQERKAAKTHRYLKRKVPVDQAGLPASFMSGESLLTRAGVSRISAALIRKDVREFTRDPAQWIPCCVMFGLLFLYSANLNRFSVDTNSRFWTGLVSYLNFGVCSLVVSTLATRFIFPLFSLEGRRLWILGLAPFNLHRVFWLKLLLFASVIALLTSGLMILSGTRLLLPWSQILHFAGGITIMSFGMTGLSLGLGVLFPNYEEANPAKIVSGYGGTLCLILNFLYILLFLTAFIAPGLIEVAPWGGQIQSHLPWLKWAGVTGILSITLLFTGITIFFSLKRIKRLECLGKL